MTTRAFLLPDLGEGLTEAALVGWLVKVGDTIAVDQPIAEVETAKSIVELPSPFAGRVVALHGEPGDTIDVGAPVLEVAADAGAVAEVSAADKEAYRQEERAGSGNVLIGYGTSETPGRGRRRPRAARAGAPASAPATPSRATGPVPVRSPLVRRLARELGLDLRTITPTGTDGAIIRADVLKAAVDTSLAAHTASLTAEPAAPGERVDGLDVLAREPLSMLRKAVSAKLTRSRSEIPDATVWVDVDATRLWELRAAMAASGASAPSITAFVARFALLALADFPLLASRLTDDGSELIRFDGVNLGVAADTARGLMVPVIAHADRMPLSELDAALRALAEEARSGSLAPEKLRGSTFTLNNYGGFGVDGSSAIINHPEVAILGIGRILERPWVVDGAIVPRRIAQLSLVFDHRVCDGGYAAGFLRRVVDAIEQPLAVYGRI